MSGHFFDFKEFNYLSDFKFPVACNGLHFSGNKKKLLAIGLYKPCVKFFDMKSSIMKFERHLVCDPLRVLPLDDEAEKFAILRSDKTIEFHTKGGLHEQLRIPTQPKDILLNPVAAELYIGSPNTEIYRFSLDQGRFLKSIPCIGANNIAFSKINGLIGSIAKTNLSFFDSRTKNEIFSKKHTNDLLCIDLDRSGLKYAIGNESGEILEYDIRSPHILRTIQLESFVKKITYRKQLIASTNNSISIVSDNNEIFKITPGFTINCFDASGGIVFLGGESKGMKGYYSEGLGELPVWFSDVVHPNQDIPSKIEK